MALESALVVDVNMIEPFGSGLYWLVVYSEVSVVSLDAGCNGHFVLSSMLTFAVVILCAIGSNTMAVSLLVLPNSFGSGAGHESLDMGF